MEKNIEKQLDISNPKQNILNAMLEPCTCTDDVAVSSRSQENSSRHAAVSRLLDIAHSLRRSGRFFAALKNDNHDKFDLVTLYRVRDRVDGVAQLLSETTKNLKLLGVDKNAPFIKINGEMIGLQEASRRIRAIQLNLKEMRVGDAFGCILITIRNSGLVPRSNDSPGWDPNQSSNNIDLEENNEGFFEAMVTFIPDAIAALFNDTEDDEARKLVMQKSDNDLQKLPDSELVRLINVLLDGPTGDDDEEAILRILESSNCDRRMRLVRNVGLKRLISDVDGSEWDRLVSLLAKCGIISFDKMDDNASRLFVNSQSCSQLGLLNMDSVRQLVLNMFSGSCGDDDEDAILKLLQCQSTLRLQQLVSMPGTDVGAFDYNFDGDQWDDLETLFATNGITLDT